jgi:hypothetical protein
MKLEIHTGPKKGHLIKFKNNWVYCVLVDSDPIYHFDLNKLIICSL